MGWAYRIADNNGVRDEPGLRNLAIDRIEIPSDGVLKIDVDRLRSGNLKLNRPNNELYSVLMTYANLEVISPQPVRDEMKRRIEQLLSHYR